VLNASHTLSTGGNQLPAPMPSALRSGGGPPGWPLSPTCTAAGGCGCGVDGRGAAADFLACECPRVALEERNCGSAIEGGLLLRKPATSASAQRLHTESAKPGRTPVLILSQLTVTNAHAAARSPVRNMALGVQIICHFGKPKLQSVCKWMGVHQVHELGHGASARVLDALRDALLPRRLLAEHRFKADHRVAPARLRRPVALRVQRSWHEKCAQ